MDNWKEKLSMAFEAPAPQRKREFLRRFDTPAMPLYAFVLSQLRYIRKWVWVMTVTIFCIAVFWLAFLPGSALWMISGLTPLLALTLVSESGRSAFYEMAELEQATRFSLRSVILARLGILGVANAVVLTLLFALNLRNPVGSPLAAGVYVITPYLLTTFIGLWIVRNRSGRDAMYVCWGAAISISCALFLLRYLAPVLYQERWLAIWLGMALTLCYGNGKQCAAMVKRTEELPWS